MWSTPQLILIVLLCSILVALSTAWLVLRRSGSLPWLGAWIALAGSALAAALRDVHPLLAALDHGLAALFPVLLVVGALRYSHRVVPAWLLGGGLALATVRAIATAAGAPIALHGLSLLFDPALAVTAAWLVHRTVDAHRRSNAHALLVPGLLILAVLEIWAPIAGLLVLPEEPMLLAWFGLSFAIAATQFVASFDQTRIEATERSQALEESGRRFDSLTSGSDDLFVELDSDGSIIWASSGWASAGEDAIRACFDARDHVRREDADYIVRGAQELRETGALRLRPIRARTLDGEWKWFEVSARLHRRSDERVTTLAIVREVTDRIDAERELARGEQRLRSILSSLGPIRAVVLDEEGHVVSIFGDSPEIRQQRYGYPRAEVIHMKITDFLYAEDADQTLEQVRKVFTTGEPSEIAAKVVLPNGDFHFNAALQPLRGRGGIEGVLALVRDVSEEVRAAEERRVIEARLYSVERFESLAVLASGIAHEFNNLLVAVSGNAELLLADLEDGATARPLLQEIVGASERAAQLTGHLTTFAGRQEFEPSTLDLGELVEETTHLMQHSLPESISIAHTQSGTRYWIDGAPELLRRMILQLITNAREASQDGDVIAVRTGALFMDEDSLASCMPHARLEPGHFAYVEVHDEGPGVPEADRERVFEPFYSTKFHGRGLGLASVLGIARQHGGAVEVKSAEGEGSTFRCYLPLAEPVPESDVRPVEETEWRPHGMVLIVDEQPLVRAVGRRMLERLGFEVLVARNGDEGRDLLRINRDAVVCVLLDATIAGRSAAETVRELRATAPELRIILSSGRHEHEARRLAEQPRTGWIDKPFRAAALRSALRALLG